MIETVIFSNGARRFYDGPRPALISEECCNHLIRDPGYHAEQPGDRCDRPKGHPDDGYRNGHRGDATWTVYADVVPAETGVTIRTKQYGHGGFDVTFTTRADRNAFINALHECFRDQETTTP